MSNHKYSKLHNELIESGLFALLKPAAQSVLLVLLYHTSDKRSWRCSPSRERIAELSGLSPPTVDKAISRLCDVGIVQRTKRKKESGGWQSIYQILSTKDALSTLKNLDHATLKKLGGAPSKIFSVHPKEILQAPSNFDENHPKESLGKQDEENKTLEQDGDSANPETEKRKIRTREKRCIATRTPTTQER